jgi:mannan endo-1,4-beta-mannosidase
LLLALAACQKQGSPRTPQAPEPVPIRLEAEDAELRNVRVSTEVPGFSGTGYVTGLIAEDIQIRWTVRAQEGIYEAWVGFRTPHGEKGYDLRVNSSLVSGMLPPRQAFSRVRAGLFELRDGANVIEIGRGWGYFDLDYVEFVPAPPPVEVKPVPPTLVNPNASPEARALMRFLAGEYGRRVLSGQYGLSDSVFVHEKTGEWPAILGGDFIDYSPSRSEFGADPKNHTEEMIEAARRGHIITMSWHWNAPKDLFNDEIVDEHGQVIDRRWYHGFYTYATHFDVAAAMADPNSEGYRLLVRDIDVIAEELKKFHRARVPVLWRPLHEAEGGWFWWGAKGPEPCIKLWRLMYERMTHHHGLNNLIWVWNSQSQEWYPGDNVVDIMSIDVYPTDRTDTLSAAWDDLLSRFNGHKLLAIAEFPGPMDVERMKRFGVRWAYFVSWTEQLGPKGSPAELVERTYKSPYTVNRRHLPRFIGP